MACDWCGAKNGHWPTCKYYTGKRAGRRKKTRRPALTMTCEQCGRRFTSRRKDARYCSTRCRTAAHRDNKKGG